MAGRDQRDHEPPGEGGGSVEWLADGTGWQLDQYEAAFRQLESDRGRVPPVPGTPALGGPAEGGGATDPVVADPPAFGTAPAFGGAPPSRTEAAPDGTLPYDPFGDDDAEDGEHWRRPRTLRVVGLILAASLLLGAVGTTIGAIFGTAAASPSLTSSVLSVGPVEVPPTASTRGQHGDPGGPVGRELVNYSVTGDGTDAGAFCAGTVTDGGTTVGQWSEIVALRGDGATVRRVSVPIDRAAFAGSPGDASVTCQPTGTGAPATGTGTD